MFCFNPDKLVTIFHRTGSYLTNIQAHFSDSTAIERKFSIMFNIAENCCNLTNLVANETTALQIVFCRCHKLRVLNVANCDDFGLEHVLVLTRYCPLLEDIDVSNTDVCTRSLAAFGKIENNKV